ncbi:MAG TPA: hypothetical protein VGK19_23155 [Capsulimonadaceae bacterium]|jgi:hypothetical protein
MGTKDDSSINASQPSTIAALLQSLFSGEESQLTTFVAGFWTVTVLAISGFTYTLLTANNTNGGIGFGSPSQACYLGLYLLLAIAIVLVVPALASAMVIERRTLSLAGIQSPSVSASAVLRPCCVPLAIALPVLAWFGAVSTDATHDSSLIARIGQVLQLVAFLIVGSHLIADLSIWGAVKAKHNPNALLGSCAAVLLLMASSILLLKLAEPDTQSFSVLSPWSARWCIVGLNPFTALHITPQQSIVNLVSLPTPTIFGSLLVALLVHRMVRVATRQLDDVNTATASAGRDQSAAGHRKRSLAGIVILTWCIGSLSSSISHSGDFVSRMAASGWIAFAVGVPFVTALFIRENASAISSRVPYQWRRSFSADPNGSLPFFHLSILAGTLGLLGSQSPYLRHVIWTAAVAFSTPYFVLTSNSYVAELDLFRTANPTYLAQAQASFLGALPLAVPLLAYFFGLGHIMYAVSQYAAARATRLSRQRTLAALLMVTIITLSISIALFVQGTSVGLTNFWNILAQYCLFAYPAVPHRSITLLFGGDDLVITGALACTTGAMIIMRANRKVSNSH